MANTHWDINGKLEEAAESKTERMISIYGDPGEFGGLIDRNWEVNYLRSNYSLFI